MNTITIPNPATRDQRDAFVQQAISRIQRALRKMERAKEQAAQRSTLPPGTSEKG